MRALVARAASRVEPDPKLQADAPELISAMLAAGYDQAAERWVDACGRMKEEAGDRCWAMLVLGAPNTSGIDLSAGRITSFIGRDKSRNKIRSALLVAGLAGLGRITPTRPIRSIAATDSGSAGSQAGRGDRRCCNPWTGRDRARAGGDRIPDGEVDQLPAAHVYHALTALERTGQDFTARMIAAEALSRT